MRANPASWKAKVEKISTLRADWSAPRASVLPSAVPPPHFLHASAASELQTRGMNLTCTEECREPNLRRIGIIPQQFFPHAWCIVERVPCRVWNKSLMLSSLAGGRVWHAHCSLPVEQRGWDTSQKLRARSPDHSSPFSMNSIQRSVNRSNHLRISYSEAAFWP